MEQWFSEEAPRFLKELAENNNKAWFDANRSRYESHVKKPMLAFAAEMIDRMQKEDPAIQMLPKEAVFRIHRDTRFGHDKTPYKTNAGMVISPGGKHDHSQPGLYFHIDGERMAIAGGCYQISPQQVQAIRTAIVGQPARFASLLEDPDFVQRFGQIEGEKNKVLPAEFREAAKAQPLLYNKQFYWWADRPTSEVTRADLPDLVMQHVRAARPLADFFTEATRGISPS